METMRSSDVLRMVPPQPQDVPQAEAQPAWSPARRILFRFAFAFLVACNFPFPLDYLGLLPHGEVIVQPYVDLWNALVPWVGKHLFQVAITVQPNGSGDTTYNYVQMFCFLAIALAATVVWTLLDRKRRNYSRLHDWLQVYVRFSLGTAMISYGTAKVIPSQFPAPSLDRLLQPYGASSPMGLLWTFMGASTAYNVFSGAAEMLGGLLLMVRRTALLGALVSIAVMTNVVMLNFCYDVPVKLYSSTLLAMAVFVALPDLRRLADLFFFNRRVEPAVDRPLFSRRWLRRAALGVQIVFIVGVTAFYFNQAYGGRKRYSAEARRKAPLHGIWNVEELVTDGRARPPLVTDGERLRRVVFDYPGMLVIQSMSDARTRYMLKLDPVKKAIALTKRDDPKVTSALVYQQPAPDLLTLEGTLDGQKISAKLRRAETKDFLLVSRGFHWINEYPFNR
jgi:hypothetical protein